MDLSNSRNTRSSVPGLPSFPIYQGQPSPLRYQVSTLLADNDSFYSHGPDENRTSYFVSQHPIYCADWENVGGPELVALSSFREGYQNRLQVVQGDSYCRRNEDLGDSLAVATSDDLLESNGSCTTAFNFSLAAETPVDYPVTHLQWDPSGFARIATSLEVLRIYQFDNESQSEPSIVQTHSLANNSTVHGSGPEPYDLNTFPPVTSFDWNKTDPTIIITLSVDTTCTVWDLNRSMAVGKHKNSAQVKTQLIAHDSEVFDVKFIHKSTNVFASVSNDGSMRVFDLRSLEHSTIIYEPAQMAAVDSISTSSIGAPYNPQALLRLLTSNVDQHHFATVGVNLNQVLIIDMRMPGVPVATLDALFGGVSHTAINLIAWNPKSNFLLTGGDDCQALVWDINRGSSVSALSVTSQEGSVVIDIPDLAFLENLEVNNACWREGGSGNWMGVVSGKGFQAVQTW